MMVDRCLRHRCQALQERRRRKEEAERHQRDLEVLTVGLMFDPKFIKIPMPLEEPKYCRIFYDICSFSISSTYKTNIEQQQQNKLTQALVQLTVTSCVFVFKFWFCKTNRFWFPPKCCQAWQRRAAEAERAHQERLRKDRSSGKVGNGLKTTWQLTCNTYFDI